MAIISIAKNTFKETSRNKISLVFLGMAIAGIFLTKAVAYISPETEEKMVIDFGIFAITFPNAVKLCVPLSPKYIQRERDFKVKSFRLQKQTF